ncbi:MAG: hypothetical protein JSS49_30500 [Planctomycetes bacterium]|nr:hypothetical protein [Planctomycetota bacterium]
MTLATAVLSHFRRLKRSNGISATVQRGEGDPVPVTIVLGATDSTTLTTRESYVSADMQDILIEVADYKPTGGVASDPEDGDVFTYDEAGQTLTVELQAPPNQKCFVRWRGGEVFVLHGKVLNR